MEIYNNETLENYQTNFKELKAEEEKFIQEMDEKLVDILAAQGLIEAGDARKKRESNTTVVKKLDNYKLTTKILQQMMKIVTQKSLQQLYQQKPLQPLLLQPQPQNLQQQQQFRPQQHHQQQPQQLQPPPPHGLLKIEFTLTHQVICYILFVLETVQLCNFH